jgi:hypothetical protein
MPGMPPLSGEDDSRDWPEHAVPEVEEIFQRAAAAGCIIFLHQGVYTVTSPDATTWMEFPARVPASSGIRRHMLADLRAQVARMLGDEMEGQW